MESLHHFINAQIHEREQDQTPSYEIQLGLEEEQEEKPKDPKKEVKDIKPAIASASEPVIPKVIQQVIQEVIQKATQDAMYQVSTPNLALIQSAIIAVQNKR